MTRRQFMRLTGTSLAATFLAGATGRAQEAAPSAAKRPNILVILADDMGYSDLGCYGSEIHTPNLDGLAEDGIRFTQFYCAARCCPSRASLLTGLYPHQAGMGGMVSNPEKPPAEGPYQGYLNDRCVTIAEVLGQAGYRTYMSGKWHVGEAAEHWPCKRGFDRSFSLISGATSYWELLQEPGRERKMCHNDAPFVPKVDGSNLPCTRSPESGNRFYMTDAFSDFAVQCLNDHKGSGEPFFLYLAYTAPHWPLHAWPSDIAKYQGKYMAGWDKLREERYERQCKLGIIDPKWPLSPRDSEVPPWDGVEDKEEWDLRMAVYAAMIDRMDQGIGRVLRALDEIGERENTLVVFLSDNGGCHEGVERRKLNQAGTQPGERGSFVAYKRPWANASNTPFRLFKHWVHEGGAATPFIARWPEGVKEQGALTHQVGHITDIMATCVDLAGASYPETRNGAPVTPLVGKSLKPIFEGRTRKPHDILYWEHFGNRAVRQGKWKLVATKKGDWELYDMEADRTELHDLSASRPDKARELYTLYDTWAEKTGVR